MECSILDRSIEIKALDKSGMLDLCEKMPIFCKDAIERAEKVELPDTQPTKIIVVGMGGSAIGGALLKDWLRDTAWIPIELCRDYNLPAYADRNTLVIAVSYSGETEETLSAFLDATRRRCLMVTISSGGHLKSFSEELDVPHIPIPQGFPPRAAIAYTFFPLVVVMKKLGVVKQANEELEAACNIIEKLSRENQLEVPLKRNTAKTLASEIVDTIPLIYGFRQYSAVAQRIKCQLNENSKMPSKAAVFPELNHNEIVGWEAPETFTKAFSIILLRDPQEPPEIRNRIEVTKRIVTPKVSNVLEITAVGQQMLAKMLSTMYIGDFASIYLALLKGIDPTPTKTITCLKREMKKRLDIIHRFEAEVKQAK